MPLFLALLLRHFGSSTGKSMFKNVIFLLLIGLNLSPFYSQNGSTEKLKENADKANASFAKPRISNKQLSKTLFVNPFVGTGGHGHTYPGASAPFGMMQLSPDTRYDGWDGCGGYHYDDSIIYGFSHTHLSGTGVADYADLLITPQVGKPQKEGAFRQVGGYGHRFSHASEKASPGYYSVELIDANIQAEMTVDVHSGMHKYTFKGGTSKKSILLDLDYRDEVISAGFKLLNKNTLQGHRVSKAWAEEQHFYFHLESNIDWTKAKLIKSKGKHKLLLIFPEDTKEILLRIGISAVDEAGAKGNLHQEISGFDFVAQRAKITKIWENELSKIYFHSVDTEIKKIFYTALYHSFLNPNTFSDVDGRYRGMDKMIHQLSDKADKHYTVFSLWDTFRATHPLFTLTQVDRTNAFIRTFLRMDEEQKDLPVWELAGNETECMIGYHSVSVISDAYMKGIQDYDAMKALAAMVRTSKDTTYSKDFYSKNGYLTLDKEAESVSKALEYAYDDFCIAQMAQALNQTRTAKEYQLRSYNFINHFNPYTGFFQARRGGMWMSPFRPDEVNFNFTEANAWQYSLFAPQAIPTLKALHGGSSKLENHLDKLFQADSKTSGRDQADITGLIGQYAHGNEPSHHMAYLYNYVGRPDKAQLYLDSILYNLYSNSPDGLSGNEDCGQMSSWFVLSAMGLYQIAPGFPYYDIGRPLLNEGEIELENGNICKILALNQSKANKYAQKAEWNGVELKTLQIAHSEIIKGGELVLTMGAFPSKKSLENTISGSKGLETEFTPLPFFKTENRIFENEQIIDLDLPFKSEENFLIEYKIENGAWNLFKESFSIHESKHIEARTFNTNSQQYSSIVSVDFVKKNTDLTIKLLTPFTLPYASSGENALIDGIQGNKEFRTGEWQGFYGFDVKSEIQFSNPKTKFTVELGMLEDLKSWIFYPTEWTVEVSIDGVNFKTFKTQKINLSTEQYRPADITKVAMEVVYPQAIKAIRVVAKNGGNCPSWHLGAGFPTWIFLDEITIK
jgi:predicted alpha-1,2-mannosidase